MATGNGRVCQPCPRLRFVASTLAKILAGGQKREIFEQLQAVPAASKRSSTHVHTTPEHPRCWPSRYRRGVSKHRVLRSTAASRLSGGHADIPFLVRAAFELPRRGDCHHAERLWPANTRAWARSHTVRRRTGTHEQLHRGRTRSYPHPSFSGSVRPHHPSRCENGTLRRRHGTPSSKRKGTRSRKIFPETSLLSAVPSVAASKYWARPGARLRSPRPRLHQSRDTRRQGVTITGTRSSGSPSEPRAAELVAGAAPKHQPRGNPYRARPQRGGIRSTPRATALGRSAPTLPPVPSATLCPAAE